ncbi:MAG: WG repeat-containing protein [Crocinitomicaceae bacterium]|nr:WG repeat-containing protein [Crocinitomicaceae bacterium]
MIRVLSVFLLCLVTSQLTAQNNEGIKPFMDYAQCYTGFKNAAGFEIWKPEFDWVTPMSIPGQNSQQYCWKVKHGQGLVGLLDWNGKIILPFIYDQIYLSRKDRLTVQLNGLWGIIDQQGNTFLELKYDQISQIGLGYIVKENGLYGMLNLDFEVVLPLEYDYVDNILLHSGYDSYGTYSNILYLIKKAGLYGIFDIDKGIVIEPQYGYVEPCWKDIYCDANVCAFKVFDTLDQTGICNSSGDLVVPLEQRETHVFTWQLDSCGTSSVSYAIAEGHEGSTGYNVKNGARTKVYEKLYAFQGRLIFLDGREWGILDSDLSEIYRSGKYLPAYSSDWTTNPIKYHSYSESFIGQGSGYDLSWNDDLIFICKSMNPTLPLDEQEFEIGLLNYVTGLQTLVKYNHISVRIKDGIKYFWAYSNNGRDKIKEPEMYLETVEVYDENMNKIGAQSYFESGRNSDDNVILTDRLTVVKNYEGLCGAISIEGELVVPFKYEYGELKISGSKNLYLFEMDDKKTLYDGKGNVVIPENYRDISFIEGGTIIAHKEKNVDFYSSGFDLILEDANLIGACHNLDRNGLFATYPVWPPATLTLAFIVDDTLMLYDNDQMIKGDSTRFDFKQDYLAIFKHPIDRFGKIISSEVSKQTAKKVKLKSPYPGTIPVAHVKDSIPYFYWRSEQSFSNSYRYSWHLYDSANIKRVNEVDFDFPLVSGKPFVRIFKSNGFFGIISEKYEILVRPEYEFIYELDGCFAILRDGLWQIYSPVNGFSSETFTAICTYSYKPGRVVFSGNKVGIIGKFLH